MLPSLRSRTLLAAENLFLRKELATDPETSRCNSYKTCTIEQAPVC